MAERGYEVVVNVAEDGSYSDFQAVKYVDGIPAIGQQ